VFPSVYVFIRTYAIKSYRDVLESFLYVLQRFTLFLVSNDDKIQFKNCSTQQREVIHRVAEKLKLNHESRDTDDDRVIYVYKQGAVIGTPTKRKVVRASLKQLSSSPVPTNEAVQKVLIKEKSQVKRGRGRPPKSQVPPIQHEAQQQHPQQNNDTSEPRYKLRSRK
jgi:hypothetical protein